MSRRREKELRCFCRATPLLATYGIDKGGKLFIHVKIYKAQRIFGELVIQDGSVKIRCRDCLRWHTIHVYNQQAVLRESHEELPEAVNL